MFDNMGWTERSELITQKFIPQVEKVLTTYGPLTLEGLHHFYVQFTAKDKGVYLGKSDLKFVLNWGRSSGNWNHEMCHTKFGYQMFFFLPSQSEKDIVTPSFSDYEYVAKYYELLERLQLIKDNPDLAALPSEWIDKLTQ